MIGRVNQKQPVSDEKSIWNQNMQLFKIKDD